MRKCPKCGSETINEKGTCNYCKDSTFKPTKIGW